MTVGDVVRSGMRGAVAGYGMGQQVGAAAETLAAMPQVQPMGVSGRCDEHKMRDCLAMRQGL